MNFDTVSCRDRMSRLHGPWNEIARAVQHPLLDYDWFAACIDNLHDEDTLHLLVAHDDDMEVQGIAPLVSRMHRGSRWLEFIGTGYLYEPSNMVAADPATISMLCAEVSRTSIPVVLGRTDLMVGQGDPARRRPPRFQHGVWIEKSASGTPVLLLDRGWEAFLGSLSSRRKADNRRALRRAAARGHPRFVAHSPGPGQEAADFAIAVGVEDRGWKGQNGSSLRQNEKLHRFFADYCSRAAESGVLRVFFLHIGDTPAAMAICVEKYGALWFLKIGYDEEYKECSPGIVLLMNIVEYCCDQGLQRVEHLGAPSDWLAPWTSFVRPQSNFVHYPNTLSGAMLFARDRLADGVNRIRRSLRN